LLDFLTTGAQFGNQSRPCHLTLDFGPASRDPNSGNAFWSRPHQWLAADAPDQFSYIWYGYDFPAFSQGSFSAGVDSGFRDLYVNYTPSPAPEPGTLAMLAWAPSDCWRGCAGESGSYRFTTTARTSHTFVCVGAGLHQCAERAKKE